MTDEAVTLAVREAISALGYVQPSSQATIERLCTQNPEMHPRAVVTSFRKEGEQISTAEKKQLGIRANGFMSRLALEQLTDKGRKIPLEAHYLTALRAGFTRMRFGQIKPPNVQLDDGYYFVANYSGVFGSKCRGCRRIDKTRADGDIISPYPPEDCDVDGCALSIRWRTRSPLMNYDD